MSYRPLRGDTTSTYDDVINQLLEGDAQLVATWVRAPRKSGIAATVRDAEHFAEIIAKATGADPVYVELEFFASTEALEEHFYEYVHQDVSHGLLVRRRWDDSVPRLELDRYWRPGSAPWAL